MRRCVELAAPVLDMNSRNSIGEQVVMRLQIPGRRADVHPISPLREVSKECFTIFQQPRKQTIFKRMIFTSRNQIEHLPLEYVGTGVDVLASALVRLPFFQKPPYAPVIFRLNDSISTWVFDGRQHYRSHCLALLMLANDGFKIEIGKDVPIENHHSPA